MKVMYLDESGDHDLSSIDSSYPVFVIGGIIVERTYARTVMEPRVRAFKRLWFGTDGIVLHAADIVRGKRGFERLRTDRGCREAFLPALSDLMRDLDYRVVACVVRKDRYVAASGDSAQDPYDLGSKVVVERFCMEIGGAIDGGIVYAEKRRPDLDHALDVAWEALRAEGTDRLNEQRRGIVDERIIGFSLKAKGVNLAGLQLADLAVSAIGRRYAGLATHDNWDIVKGKLCRDERGRGEGYGLVVLPDRAQK